VAAAVEIERTCIFRGKVPSFSWRKARIWTLQLQIGWMPKRRLTVRRTIYLFAVLLCLAAAMPLFATQRTLVDDVIRMSQAGVSEETIISFVHNARGRFDVSADDVIAMTSANVSKGVIKVVVDEAAARNDRDYRAGDQRPNVVVAPSVYAPYGYYGYGYYPYYYDPFFYPRVSLNFGFVGRGFFGGHGGHGRH
jgi:hypothetical protein